MTRKLGAAVLALLVAFGCAMVAACGTSDGSITSLTAIIEKQTSAVKEGKFDKEAFKKEAEPHVKAMAAQKDGGTVSKSISDKFTDACKHFGEACAEKGNKEAMDTFQEVMKPVTG